MRAALVGNYGVGNLGDEALRDYFLQAFPDVEWQVLSAHPQAGEFARLPGGIRSFLSFRWVRTLGAFRRVDAVVFGGGSLFTDVESPFACFLWWIHAKAASLLGKPVVLAFQGMGPYKTGVGEWFARSVVRKAAFISVRDEESARRIASWPMSTEVIQTFDPVFSLMVNKNKSISSKNVFIIIPRKNSNATFLENVYQELKNSAWEEVRVVLMEGEHEDERQIAQDILSKVTTKGSMVSVHTLDELMDSLKDASLVFAQRFHGALAALAVGVPLKVFPQGAGDKMSVAQAIAQEGTVGVDRLVAQVKEGEEALRRWFMR